MDTEIPTVLLVECNSRVRQSIARMLLAGGFGVLAADEPQAAVRAAESHCHRIDVLVARDAIGLEELHPASGTVLLDQVADFAALADLVRSTIGPAFSTSVPGIPRRDGDRPL